MANDIAAFSLVFRCFLSLPLLVFMSFWCSFSGGLKPTSATFITPSQKNTSIRAPATDQERAEEKPSINGVILLQQPLPPFLYISFSPKKSEEDPSQKGPFQNKKKTTHFQASTLQRVFIGGF